MNWPYWKSRLARKLGMPEKYSFISLAEAAHREGWDLRIILPPITQSRLASHTTAQCHAEYLAQAEQWITESAATRSYQDRAWGEKLYRELYSDETMELPEVHQCDLRDVSLETLHGCARTARSELVMESSLVHAKLCHATFRDTPARPAADRPFFSFLASWPGNYAHWLMDVLPKLAAVDFNLEGRIALLPNKGPDFQIDSLRLLGVPEGQILRAPAPVIRIKDVRITVTSTHTGIPRLDLMQRLRAQFRKNIGDPGSEKFIYISRARSRRPLTNDEAVRRMLKERGFFIVENESLTFTDQVRLYAGASIIVGAHGAGNYNLVFAQPGTQLLEIYNPLYWDGAAARISSLLGIEHWHVYGENLSEDYRTSVDLHRLARALDEMASLKQPI